MNEDTRRMLEEVYAADDAARADFEAWQARQPIKRRDAGDMGLVQDALVPQQSTQMDQEQQKAWDAWVTAHIENGLVEFADWLGTETARGMSEYVHKRLTVESAKLREHVSEEIRKLRTELIERDGQVLPWPRKSNVG